MAYFGVRVVPCSNQDFGEAVNRRMLGSHFEPGISLAPVARITHSSGQQLGRHRLCYPVSNIALDLDEVIGIPVIGLSP